MKPASVGSRKRKVGMAIDATALSDQLPVFSGSPAILVPETSTTPAHAHGRVKSRLGDTWSQLTSTRAILHGRFRSESPTSCPMERKTLDASVWVDRSLPPAVWYS